MATFNKKNMADIICNHKKHGVKKKIHNRFCKYAIENNQVA